MVTLNRAASEALLGLPAGSVHACTDVTGFGLIGHAAEMAAASGVTLDIRALDVPVIEGVRDLAHGNIPGGGRTNAEHFSGDVEVASTARSAARAPSCTTRKRPEACWWLSIPRAGARPSRP